MILFINLTPCVPLSLVRRGGSMDFEGASPLQTTPIKTTLMVKENASKSTTAIL